MPSASSSRSRPAEAGVAEHLAGGPSDETPAILRTGRGPVAAAVFGMSVRSPTGDDAAYIKWHLLDHLPEQYRVGGIRHGVRWVSTPDCRQARALRGGALDAVDHVVNYLVAPPVRESLEPAHQLMVALGDVGRMPSIRPPQIHVGLYELVGKAAAPRAVAGADVMPWRPARAVYLLVERLPREAADDRAAELDALVMLSGVAGVWRYAGGLADRNPDQVNSPPDLRVTVCYLDEDMAGTSAAVAPLLRRRWADSGIEPLLAGPFLPIVPWEWDRNLP
jgi:hypothetical protein